MKIQVLHNQSLLDVAIQQHGSVLTVLNWSLANQKSITDELEPGQLIEVPTDVENSFPEVADFYKNHGIVIGTAYTSPEAEPQQDNYEFPQGEFPISF